MARVLYRYTFDPEVPVEEAEASLLLAILAAEGLHGEAEVRLDGAHFFDPDARRCVIAADARVGRDLNKLFVGFLRREFGEDAFRVERLDRPAGAGERRPGDVAA